MPILKSFLTLCLIFILALLFVGYSLPKGESVMVSRTLKCDPTTVYTNVSNLKNWDKWASWHQKDPAMIKNYGAISAGKGASYDWSGNWKVGKGHLEVLDAVENTSIKMKLQFDPKHSNISDFLIKPSASGTEVHWSISMQYSDNWFVRNFLQGYQYVLMNKMVASDYNHSLDNLENTCP